MKQVQVFTPDDVTNSQNPAPLSSFNLQFLAQGDSWFSFGAIPPTATTNLFDGMSTSTVGACVVNCASPGARLSLMADTARAPDFMAFLNGKLSRRWAGLLLSGGGNDLIAAAQQPPVNAPSLRLLATQGEWTNGPGAERYLSNAGWQTFSDHLAAVFGDLLAARDSGKNRNVPIVMHTYDVAVAHNSSGGLGFGPWLYPAMKAFHIPEKDWPAVSRALLGRLQTLIDHMAATTADGSVHVVHGQGTLTPAHTGDTGPTPDWVNEIHPSKQGYRKLSGLWRPVLDAVFT